MAFVDEIRAISIEDYAARLGFTVVSKGSKYSSIKEHDSVIIDRQKNCFWRNSVFSIGVKGGAGTVIDFAMEFGGCTNVSDAMSKLKSIYGIDSMGSGNSVGSTSRDVSRVVKHIGNATISSSPDTTQKSIDSFLHPAHNVVFELPKKADDTKAIWGYLVHKRHIEPSVFRYFEKKNMLYQDNRNNCVFVGLDNKKQPSFASIRGTGDTHFRIDVAGSDYNNCIYVHGNDATSLVVNEAVIDTMSYMTKLAREGLRYSDNNYLALSGTNKLAAAYSHIEDKPYINKIVIAFDNDSGGHKAAQSLFDGLCDRGFKGEIVIEYPTIGKDWNEYICELENGDNLSMVGYKMLISEKKEDCVNRVTRDDMDFVIKAETPER